MKAILIISLIVAICIAYLFIRMVYLWRDAMLERVDQIRVEHNKLNEINKKEITEGIPEDIKDELLNQHAFVMQHMMYMILR
jgi:hypothetical protein